MKNTNKGISIEKIGVNTNDRWSYRFKLDYQIDNREKIVNFREVRGA